jgi:hypothetical protein
MFIKQIFYGIIEKKNFLKPTVKEFLKTHHGSTEIVDEILYTIFIYIAVFRMNELSLNDFKSLVIVNKIKINFIVTRFFKNESIIRIYI